MSWEGILTALVSSGILITLLEWLRYRKKDNAETSNSEADAETKISDNAIHYAEKLEDRMAKLEHKIEKLEMKIVVFQCAINCAYKCQHIENPEEDCPVVGRLNESDKEERDNGNNQR